MGQNVAQTFYEEFTDDPRTYRVGRPCFDLEDFQKKLSTAGGSAFGKDRLRIRWGGDCEEYILEVFETQTGWVYREDGQEKFVDIKNTSFEFPDGAMVGAFFETLTVYVPRFVVEELAADGNYYRAWWVETTSETLTESGRVDIVSRYREPSNRDLLMAAHLKFLRENLTKFDIEKGLAARKELEERRRALSREELVDEMAEEFTQALTDGIKPAKEIDFTKEFSPNYIKEYSQALIEAHNQSL